MHCLNNLQGTSGSEYAPIHYIAEKGHTALVALLKAKGANLDLKDVNDYTPLDRAFVNKQFKTMKALHEAGATKMNKKGEHKGVIAGEYNTSNTENLKLIFACGIEADFWKNDKLWTLLHYACEEGKKEIAEILIKNNADLNAITCDGENVTPIYIASQFRKKELVKLLLKEGADANIRKQKGTKCAPIHIAIERQYSDIVDILVKLKKNLKFLMETHLRKS